MPDLRISQLPAVGAAALAATDPLPLADLSASETKKVTIKDLLQGGIAFIDDGSIPSSKIDASVPPGSVGTVELADKSVTAIKLADNSTVLVQATPPAVGTYVGQILLDTDDDKVSCWNGNTWVPVKAAGSVNSIVSGDNDVLELTIVITGDAATIVPSFKAAVGANQFAAGPTGSGGPVSLRSIASSDLPPATNSVIGGISTPVGGGLRTEDPSGLGQNANTVIDNDIAASLGVNHLVTYSDKGLVLSGRTIVGTDLPDATAGTGGVIKAGTEFTVDPTGILNHANQVTPGTFPKVTYDGQGHIKSGAILAADDIPELPAERITTGLLLPSVIRDGSITKEKLADYATAYIQEAEPTSVSPGFNGVLWYQESTAQLRMWNGNSWNPVGFGRLSNDNLRWGGTINADTGLITGVTSSGTTAGLTIGEALPEATDNLGGLYLLVDTAGDNIAVTPGLGYDAGDWCLCVSETEGWIRIDIAGGGGGGGGASSLGQLLDVTLSGASANQLLQLQANNQWQNVTLTAADFGGLVAGDNVSELVNDAGYLVAADIPADAVVSVNGKSGIVVLTPADIGAATAAEGALAVTALQPGDDISELNNDSGYITAADIPALNYVPTGSWAALPSL